MGSLGVGSMFLMSPRGRCVGPGNRGLSKGVDELEVLVVKHSVPQRDHMPFRNRVHDLGEKDVDGDGGDDSPHDPCYVSL